MSKAIHLLCRGVMLPLVAYTAFAAGATPVRAPGSERPAGIAQGLPSAGGTLVSVVAADIDADGDLDVVATDGSLDLLVWVNDGSGVFTRKRPAPPREPHTRALGPGLDTDAPFSNVYTSSTPSSVSADARLAIAVPFGVFALIRFASDPATQTASPIRRPRGPPSGSLLTL